MNRTLLEDTDFFVLSFLSDSFLYISFQKSATLPTITKTSERDVSSTGSDDEIEKHEDEDDDDEPELIKPKKVLMVPIGGPLAGININKVQLRKVEPKDEKQVRVQYAFLFSQWSVH